MTSIIRDNLRNLHWSQWLSPFGLAVLFLALRWNNFNAPFIRDEGECDYAAQLLICGIAPYQHAFIQKPPGVVYSYALADLLLPRYFWAPRLLAYLFVVLATILLGFIARLEFGKGFALPAMWLMTPMILLPGIDQYSCNPEMFMLLPLLATVAVYCYSRQHGNKNKHWLAAGFLAAITIIYKYTAVPILALVFVAWLFEMHRSGARPGAIVKAFACTMAGGILATVLGLGFYAGHSALGSLWECTVVFNRYYLQTSGAFSSTFFWNEIKTLWDTWWILFLVPWAILLQPSRRIVFWLGLFICALVSTSGCSYTQYYILIMPGWALLNVAGIRALALKTSPRAAWPSSWIVTLVTAIVMLPVLSSDAPWMLLSSKQFSQATIDGPFIEAQLMADKVSHITSPNDFVFVAGSEPEILCYAQRFSPTRFITSYPLMIPSPVALGYQNAAIGDLEKQPPKIIVFVASGESWIRHANSPPDFFAFLNDFLDQNYKMVGGYVKTDGKNGYWSEPISNEQFTNASLVLFELKR